MKVSSTTSVQPSTAIQSTGKSTGKSAGSSRQSAPTTAKAAVASTVQSAQAQASSSTTRIANPTYTTSVGGKSYSGNVQQSGGHYTVSVPNLPGASASGSSLQAAENALNVKIDVLA